LDLTNAETANSAKTSLANTQC